MKSKYILLNRLSILPCIAVVSLIPSISLAGDHTWDGGSLIDSSWLSGANWDDDPVGIPAFGVDSVQTFNALEAGNLATFVATNPNVGKLVFNAAADSDISITLANALSSGATRNLNFTVSTGDAELNIDPDATGNFRIGVNNGSVTLASNLVINHNGTGVLTIDRPISEVSPDPGPRSVTKNGTGELTLSGANNFDGGLTLNSGTLNINQLNCLGGTTALPGNVTINGGTIDNKSTAAINISSKLHTYAINGDFVFAGTQNLSFSTGPVNLGTAAGISRTITTTAGTLTIGGVIADGTTATGLAKAGAGTLTLNGANTYTGPTLINSGSLVIGGTASFSSSGVAVGGSEASGTPTLSGQGTVNVPTMIAAAAGGVAGTHSVNGTSAGSQTFTNSLTYGSGATLIWQVNPGQAADPGEDTNNFGLYDKVIANGAAGSVAGSSSVFRITLSGGFTFSDAFWATDKVWTDVFSGPGAPTDLAAIFSSFSGTFVDSNGIVSGEGQFSLVGPNLVWTAGAAPTNLYDIWSAGLTNPAFDFDSDGDGIENGLEWILGGNASLNDTPSVLPVAEGDSTTGLTLTFTREEDSIPETTLTLEYATDLAGPWTPAIIDENGGIFPNDVEITIDEVPTPDDVTIMIPASNAPNGRIFARLKAVRN